MGKRATLMDFAPVKRQAAAEPAPEPKGEGSPKVVDTRKGQTLRLSVEAWRQLKIMAAEETRPVHDMLVEAVNDLFRKQGKPPIA